MGSASDAPGHVQRRPEAPGAALVDAEGPRYAAPTSLLEALRANAEDASLLGMLAGGCSEGCLRAEDAKGRSALHLAAVRGRTAVLRRLLELGAGAGADGADRARAARAAAGAGHLGAVEVLLASRCCGSRKARGSVGRAALFRAATKGRVAVVRWLLDQGVTPSARGGSGGGATPLMAAASNGHACVLEALASSHGGGGIDARDGFGRTALCLAAGAGRLDCVRCLLGAGADPKARDGRGLTALADASSGGHAGVVGALLEAARRGGLEARDDAGRDALYRSAGKGHLAVVRRLLEAGADPKARGGPCGAPLSAAAAGGHTEVVRLLLASLRPACLDARNLLGCTAVWAAAQGGHAGAVHLLLRAGADAALSGNGRVTPLMVAAAGGHADVVDALLASSRLGDLDARDKDGGTALLRAADDGRSGALLQLVDAGGDAKVCNNKGRSPLMAAAACGHLDVLETLLASTRLSDLEACDMAGRTALAHAAGGRQLECVRRLLEHGADPTRVVCNQSQGKACQSALSQAVEGGSAQRLAGLRWHRRRKALVMWRRAVAAQLR